jgi:hypothetical protein
VIILFETSASVVEWLAATQALTQAQRRRVARQPGHASLDVPDAHTASFQATPAVIADAIGEGLGRIARIRAVDLDAHPAISRQARAFAEKCHIQPFLEPGLAVGPNRDRQHTLLSVVSLRA